MHWRYFVQRMSVQYTNCNIFWANIALHKFNKMAVLAEITQCRIPNAMDLQQ